MPDIDIAMEVIDLYTKKFLIKPEMCQTKYEAIYVSQQWQAIDNLKNYMRKYWFSSPSSDIVYNFVKRQHYLYDICPSDQYYIVAYKLAKEILYYFV